MDNLVLMIDWHLRKIVPILEVLLSVTMVVCTDSMIFLWVVWTLLSQ